jgi:hypothetical protein
MSSLSYLELSSKTTQTSDSSTLQSQDQNTDFGSNSANAAQLGECDDPSDTMNFDSGLAVLKEFDSSLADFIEVFVYNLSLPHAFDILAQTSPPAAHAGEWGVHENGIYKLEDALSFSLADIKSAYDETGCFDSGIAAEVRDIADRIVTSTGILQALEELYIAVDTDNLEELAKVAIDFVTKYKIAEELGPALVVLREAQAIQESVDTAYAEIGEAAVQTLVQTAITGFKIAVTPALLALGPIGAAGAVALHFGGGMASSWVDKQLGTEPHQTADSLRSGAKKLTGDTTIVINATTAAFGEKPPIPRGIAGPIALALTALDGVMEMGAAGTTCWIGLQRLNEMIPDIEAAVKTLGNGMDFAEEMVGVMGQLVTSLEGNASESDIWIEALAEHESVYGETLYAI